MNQSPKNVPTVPGVDQLYWRAYSSAILTLITSGAPLGHGLQVYVAPQNQRGIAGGRFIPDIVTNNLLYNIADDLLPVDSPIYVPGGSAKYTQQLAQYLNYVEVSSKKNPDKLDQLNQTLQQLNVAQALLDSSLNTAILEYSQISDTDKTPFEEWCNQNAPALISARSGCLAASEAYNQALLDYYGPNAGSLISCIDNVKLAQNELKHVLGFNMPCTLADLTNIEGLWNDSDGGQKAISDIPNKIFYEPAFSMQGYRDTVDFWVSQFGKDTSTIKINMADGAKVTWKKMGFSSVNFAHHAPYWYVFSTTGGLQKAPNGPTGPSFKFLDLSGDVEKTTPRLRNAVELELSGAANKNTPSPRNTVELELVVNGMQTFSVSPGAWDIPGVKKLFPKLRAEAPDDLSTSLVRVDSLLLAYGVGINATFNKSATDTVHTLLQNAQTSGGTARIFGFDIVSRRPTMTDRSRAVTFDDLSWDQTTGSLSIPPVSDGYPTLLGVLGRRL